MKTESKTLDKNKLSKRIEEITPLGLVTQEIARSVADRNNAKVTELSFKSVESIARKCSTRNCSVDDLRDLARTTIVCHFGAIPNVVKDLINTLKEKDCFGRFVQQEYETRGYWGVIINPVFFCNGKMVMTEIQITSYEMFYASHTSDFCSSCLGESLYKNISKNIGVEGGKGHLYYEISRDMTGTYTSEQKKQAEVDNYNYYHNFWGEYKFGKTKFLNMAS